MKSVHFTNPRSGEIWICENLSVRRKVDGVDFIEVHRPDNQRMVWMNLNNLKKISEKKIAKKF